MLQKALGMDAERGRTDAGTKPSVRLQTIYCYGRYGNGFKVKCRKRIHACIYYREGIVHHGETKSSHCLLKRFSLSPSKC